MDKQEILKQLDELREMIDELEEDKAEPEYLNELYTFEGIQELAKSGEADKKISIGDQLKVDRNGKDIIFDVVKITSGKIYLLSHYLIANMPFDAPEPGNSDKNIAEYGSNDYLNSSARQWINSADYSGDWWEPKTEYDTPIGSKDFLDGFVYGMDTGFLDILECDENGDKFFLPSEDEIKEWFPNEKDRIKSYASGEKDWYWTRTPYSGNSNGVRHVTTSGTLNYYGACGACGVAPVCIIGNLSNPPRQGAERELKWEDQKKQYVCKGREHIGHGQKHQLQDIHKAVSQMGNGWKNVRWKANEVQNMIKCECPCKDCTQRRLGCHENCVKYKIYRELYYRDKRKKRIYFAMYSDMSDRISKRVLHKTKYQLMKRKAGN